MSRRGPYWLGDALMSRTSLPTPRARGLFVGVLWLFVAITCVAYGLAAWLIVRDGVPPKAFGWLDAAGDAGRQVTEVDSSGPAARLLFPDDRLVSLNGDGNIAQAGTTAYRKALPLDEAYRLQVARDGDVRTVELVVRPNSRRASARLAYVVTSFTWCFVGLFIGFARPELGVARLGFAAGVMTGLSFFDVGVLPSDLLGWWNPLQLVVGLHFFSRFPAGDAPPRLWRRLLVLLYLGGAVAALIRLPRVVVYQAGGAEAMTRWLAYHPMLRSAGSNLGLLVFVISLVGLIAVLVRKYRVLTGADDRRRLRWVVYGSIVGLTGQLLVAGLVLIEQLGGPNPPLAPTTLERLSFILNVLSVAIPLSVAYAVVKHRVLDIRVAVRVGVQYVLARRALQVLLVVPLVALAVTLVSARNRTLAELVTGSTGYLYWVGAMGLSLAFRRPMRTWLDRRFFRDEYDREQVLIGLLRDLGDLESLEAIAPLVRSRLERALHPKVLHLWYRNSPEQPRRSDSRAPTTPPLSVNLLTHLERTPRGVDLEAPGELSLSGDEARWLSELGVQLLIPLSARANSLSGVLLLGERKSEQPYGPRDCRMLEAIGRQVAVVCDNLQLRDQVDEEARIRREVLGRLDRRGLNLLKQCPACGACYDAADEMCERDGSRLSLALPVERTIAGRYRLDQLLGEGGMGAVYESHDLQLDRPVAVKVMLGRDFGRGEPVRRFRQEARAAARLSHPNIVDLHDFGTVDGGGAYLVMERVQGITLRAALRRSGALSLPDAADWFDQVLEGVDHAHTNGVIHRDLKPENLIGRRGVDGTLSVTILDFGLAKLRPLEGSGIVTGTASAVMGTLGYMSPEQLAGLEVDGRTDLFAVGVMVFEVLTGVRPFRGDSYAQLSAAMLGQRPRLPEGPPGVQAIEAALDRCLAPNIHERFKSAAEARAELVRALRTCAPLDSMRTVGTDDRETSP